MAAATASKKATVAISYIRFSSRKQAQGDSQRRQTELAEAYCRRKGWTLSQQTYQDLGVSAFRGKNALVGNLGEFLKAVQSGTVPSGTVLIVESLDRISRQGIDEGYDLIKKILKADIVLVTLTPEREFEVSATKSLSRGALEIQLILERAAEESERRSERIAAAWQGKRLYAREGKPMPPRKKDGRVTLAITDELPAWIREKDGKMELVLERGKVVQRIFALAATGYGRSRIVQALRAEGIPSFTGNEQWSSASIGFILTDGRARGIYQPCKSGRVPDGPPILNYYPPAVTEQQWLAARAGMSQRRRTLKVSAKPWTKEEDELVRQLSVGQVARRTARSRAAVYQRRHALGLTATQDRQSKQNFVNVFNGLLHDALPPYGNFIAVTRMDATGSRRALLNHAHTEGKAPCRLFPLEVFERAILGAMREIDPRDILPPSEEGTAPDEVSLLQDQLNAIGSELAEAAVFMEANGFSTTIGQRVAALDKKKEELGGKLLDAKARAACPAEQAWAEYGSLLEALENAADQRDARLRLQGVLRRIVEGIWFVMVPRGRDRLAEVDVRFVGGSFRNYTIIYRPTRSNGFATQPGRWWAISIKHPDDELPFNDDNLRDSTTVDCVQGSLEKYPQELIEEFLAKGHPLP